MSGPLPSNLSLCGIKGQAGYSRIVPGDPDGLPNFVPVVGLIATITAPTYLLDATATPNPVIIVPDPLVLTSDASGYFRDVDDNLTAYVIASDDPQLNPTGWNYKVTFSGTGASAFSTFYFPAPSGGTVDLGIITPVANTLGIGTSAAEAAAAAAAASATAAATSAATAASTLASKVEKPAAAVNSLTGWYHVSGSGYGATGNGTTDDTAAIQAAIDAAFTAGGGTVFFKQGTYLVTTLTLKQAVTLRSDGGIYNYTAPARVTIKSTTPSAVVIDTPATSITGCAIEGITVLGANNAAVGIRFQNVSWGAIRNCMVQGFNDQGILVAAGAAAVLEDILVVQCLLTRDRGAIPAGAVEIRGTDAFVARVEAGTGQTVISSGTANASAFLITGNANMFSVCVGEFADHAFTVSGRFNSFTGCRADLSFHHAYQVLTGAQSGKNTFAGCQGWDNGRAATNTYAAYYVTSLGNVFAGCKANQDGSGTWNASTKFVFQDETTPASTSQRNEYVGCSGDFDTAMFKTGGVEADRPWPNYPTTITVSGTYVPPVTAKWLEIVALGCGGAGGGGGSASATTTQVGGGGGAGSVPIVQVVPATTLTIVVGAAAVGGAGGVANGNAGAAGANGTATTVTGTGVATTAPGGRGGAGGGANSTTTVGGGLFGVSAITTGQSLGSGGFASSGAGAAGGNNTGHGGGAGSGGVPANATLGGSAGNPGTANTGGAQPTGQTGTTAGGNAAAATAYGAGGGGGGGGAPTTGAGGTGGNGGPGVVIVRVVG